MPRKTPLTLLALSIVLGFCVLVAAEEPEASATYSLSSTLLAQGAGDFVSPSYTGQYVLRVETASQTVPLASSTYDLETAPLTPLPLSEDPEPDANNGLALGTSIGPTALVTWTPSDAFVSFNMYRQDPGETEYCKINVDPITAQPFLDHDLANGLYRYRVYGVTSTDVEVLWTPVPAAIIIAMESASAIWVDFDWTGAEDGTEDYPFDTLANGLDWLDEYGTLKIKTGTSATTTTFSMSMRIEAHGGSVRIGE
jgi:hypothetical protein